MNATGLLLGAGASYDLGMPLVQELTAELKRWLTPTKLEELNSGWRASGLGYSDEAISTLSAVLTVEYMTYEHIMGHLQVHFSRHGDQGYHGLFAFLSEIVYALLKERHILNTERIEQSISYLSGITGLAVINRPLWVFSLRGRVTKRAKRAPSVLGVRMGWWLRWENEQKTLPQRFDRCPVGRIGSPAAARHHQRPSQNHRPA